MSRGQVTRSRLARIAVFAAVVVLGARIGWSQELGGAGTIQGTVKDPTGGVMAAVSVELSNPLTGLRRTTTTDPGGRFVFRNLPPNPYHVSIAAQGFAPYAKDVEVRSAVPIEIEVPLALAGATATVDVVGHAEDLVERDPTAHTDIDQSLISKLPMESVAAGLNQVITLASPGVVSDSNGFFHPDRRPRADAVLDRQPAGDRPAEPRLFQPDLAGRGPVDGGHHRRRAGRIRRQEQSRRPHRHQVGPRSTEADRELSRATFGSFSSPAFEANIGGGSHTVGKLPVGQRAADRPVPRSAGIRRAARSWLQPVASSTAWMPIPAPRSTFHLNVQGARSSFDVPNTFDQNDLGQDQHQKIDTFNVAPGYSQVHRWRDAVHGQRASSARIT